MAITIKYKKTNNVKLIYIIIFVLVLVGRLPTIYVFSQMKYINLFINSIQLPMYGGLIYIIMQKKYTTKELLLFSMVGVVLLLGYRYSGQAAYFKGFLLIIAVKDLPYREILNECRKALMIVLIMGITLYLMGISDSGLTRRGIGGCGFVHPNVTAQLIMIIFLLYSSEKAGLFKLIDYVLIELGGIISFALTGSRTSTIIICLIPVVLFIGKSIIEHAYSGMVLRMFMIYSQLIVMMFTYLSVEFLENSIILKELDLILSNRLFLNYYSLNKFGIKLFGQNVNLTDNSGTIYNNIRGMGNWSVTCDCSYMVSLIIMGLIPTIIVMVGFVILMKKAIKRRNYMVMSMAFLLALYSFNESQMIEIYSFFVYFYIKANDNILDDIEVKKCVKHGE